MSELHQGLDQSPDERPAEAPTPAADVVWPELPSEQHPAEPSGHAAPEHAGHGSQAGEQPAAVLDPAVNAVLARLGAVQQMPVSGHGDFYAGMHDALLEALNEDVAGHAGVVRRIHATGNGGS
jgi:3-oxoacyl-ACP reductase-like protein